MSALSERLQAMASRLGERATREMYEDPFWQARFGSRGREMAEKDSQFHLAYLVQALAAEDPSVFESYARWLQTLLVSRGMCSRHIAESFERLARAIEDDVNDAGPALDVLRAGQRALVYPTGPARELQACAEPLAERALEALASRQPSWFSMASTRPSMAAFESVAQAEQARFKRDVLDQIAYLADAMHAGRSELFANHVVWMQSFGVGRQGPVTRMQETLLALDECLGPPAPAAVPEPAALSAATSPEERGAERTSAAGAVRGSEAPAARASLRPARQRPSLSPPPPSPVPLPVSAELGALSRQFIELALQRLVQPGAVTTDASGVATAEASGAARTGGPGAAGGEPP